MTKKTEQLYLSIEAISARMGGIPSPRTLRDYAKRPDFPTPKRTKPWRWLFSEVENYVAKNHGLNGQTGVGTEASNAKVEKIKLDLERSRYEFDIQRGLYIHRDEITSTFEPIVAGIRADLQKFFEDELPPQYKGRTRAECQQLNAAAVDKIIENIRNGAAPVINQATVAPAEKATG